MDEVFVKYGVDKAGFDKTVEDIKKKYNELLIAEKELVADLKAWRAEEKRFAQEVAAGTKGYADKLSNARNEVIKLEQAQKGLKKEIKETEKAQKDLEKSTNKLGETFKKVGTALAGAFAIHKIIEFTKQSVIEFAKEEAAIEKLNVQLVNNNKNVQAVSAQYQAFAKEMQRTIIIQDDEVIRLLQLAESYKAANPQEAVKGAIALSKAFGIDLDSALKAAIKGETGQWTAVQRLIPTLKLVGDETQKAAMFQQILADGFKVASGEIDSAEGKLHLYNTAINELKEAFGNLVINGTGLGDLLKNLSQAMNNFTEGTAKKQEEINDKKLTEEERFNKTVSESTKQQLESLQKQNDYSSKIAFDRWKKAKTEQNDAERKYYSMQYDITLERRQKIQSALDKIDGETKKKTTVLTEEQIAAAKKAAEEFVRLQKEADTLILQYMTEGYDKQVALENARYEEERAKFKGHKKALEAIEKQHQLNLMQISIDAQMSKVIMDENFMKTFEEKQLEANQKKLGVAVKYEGDIEANVLASNAKIIEDDDKVTQAKIDNIFKVGYAMQGALSALALLNQDNAEYQKNVAIAQIAINEALSIAQAIASVKAADPVSYVIAALAITGSVISAFAGIKAQLNKASIPAPGFAEGVLDLQGNGTETSDSINARLSKHESVMTAKETKKHYDELKAMKDGTFDELIYSKYLKPKTDLAANMLNSLSLQAELNDERIVRKLSNTNMILIKNNSMLINALRGTKVR